MKFDGIRGFGMRLGDLLSGVPSNQPEQNSRGIGWLCQAFPPTVVVLQNGHSTQGRKHKNSPP
jgi:hypothetical protein